MILTTSGRQAGAIKTPMGTDDQLTGEEFVLARDVVIGILRGEYGDFANYLDINDSYLSGEHTLLSVEGIYEWPFECIEKINTDLALHGWYAEPYSGWAISVYKIPA